jgi:hypothetical protein
MTKKSKGSDSLGQETAVAEVSGGNCTEITDPNDERETIFINLLVGGFSPHQAALKAGYSKSYASSGVYQKLKKSERLQTKIMQAGPMLARSYRRFTQAALPEIAEIEANALGEYRKDPKLAITRPALLKQVKIAAGVLNDDQRPPTPKINIGKLQIAQMIVSENLTQGLSGSHDLAALDITPDMVDSDPGEE